MNVVTSCPQSLHLYLRFSSLIFLYFCINSKYSEINLMSQVIVISFKRLNVSSVNPSKFLIKYGLNSTKSLSKLSLFEFLRKNFFSQDSVPILGNTNEFSPKVSCVNLKHLPTS